MIIDETSDNQYINYLIHENINDINFIDNLKSEINNLFTSKEFRSKYKHSFYFRGISKDVFTDWMSHIFKYCDNINIINLYIDLFNYKKYYIYNKYKNDNQTIHAEYERLQLQKTLKSTFRPMETKNNLTKKINKI